MLTHIGRPEWEEKARLYYVGITSVLRRCRFRAFDRTVVKLNAAFGGVKKTGSRIGYDKAPGAVRSAIPVSWVRDLHYFT